MASSATSAAMTDELFSQYTYYKIQYGPQNVAMGKAVIRSFGHFVITEEEIIWYRKPDSGVCWYCDARQVDYTDRRFPFVCNWWLDKYFVFNDFVDGAFTTQDKLHRTVFLPSVRTQCPVGWSPGVEGKIIWW